MCASCFWLAVFAFIIVHLSRFWSYFKDETLFFLFMYVKINFRDILGSQNHWKSVKISMQTCYWNAVWIFITIWWFSPHFYFQNALQNHLNIDFGSFSRRFGIDLVLQGRIWMDSDWPGLDFSMILDRFWLYFEWIERSFCKQRLDEQYALIAALNIAIGSWFF